ncbi:carnitine dehydratase [Arthrobacter sp. MYb227]|uniref:CaiB/BaiF CoA transferase family protein n=1 Tax=Arthrobacter sp. MYb227 TaxID=1848601 RepID=UPI000CFC96DB|nr:CoA transferase [Arthrobacter sp. MYb227]PQZ94970.1 carnitine dehydratase [Arthrobacter sp. MYb227]
MNQQPGPLNGIKVLDFGQYIAGPGAGQTLSDLGATVIKIENVRGDQARSIGVFGEAMIRAYNRDKASLSLDLRKPEARIVVHQLLADTDVLIHNFRPGAAERLGLGAEAVRDQYPTLIYGSITGFGTSGPSSTRPGLDIAAQAEFGIMESTGEENGDPQRVGFAVVDVAAANALATGILTALFARFTTGQGAHVETSLMESAISMQAATWGEYTITGEPGRRKGNGQGYAAPAADLVRVKDGMIVLSAYTAEKWAALCTTIGHPEFIDDPRFVDNPARVAHRPKLLELLGTVLSTSTRAEVVELLLSNGIVCGSVRAFDELDDDADLAASGVMVKVDSEGETYSSPGVPFTLDGWRRTTSAEAPELGAQNSQILAGLGYTVQQIEELHTKGVVCTPPVATIGSLQRANK